MAIKSDRWIRRMADEFKIFTNINSTIVDPKDRSGKYQSQTAEVTLPRIL